MLNRIPGGARAKNRRKGFKMASNSRWPPKQAFCIVYATIVTSGPHYRCVRAEYCSTINLHMKYSIKGYQIFQKSKMAPKNKEFFVSYYFLHVAELVTTII